MSICPGVRSLSSLPGSSLPSRRSSRIGRCGGLRLWAVEQNLEAAFAAGVHPVRRRAVTLLIPGFLGGLAGARLSLGKPTLIKKAITGCNGFTVLAAFDFVASGLWAYRGGQPAIRPVPVPPVPLAASGLASPVPRDAALHHLRRDTGADAHRRSAAPGTPSPPGHRVRPSSLVTGNIHAASVATTHQRPKGRCAAGGKGRGGYRPVHS